MIFRNIVSKKSVGKFGLGSIGIVSYTEKG